MTQQSLFDGDDHLDKPQAAARRTDPATSHEAAENHEASGNATSHRIILACYVRSHPGCTNGEASRDLPNIGYQEITRRMGEIAKAGAIRRGEPRLCSVNGTKQTTWWPA